MALYSNQSEWPNRKRSTVYIVELMGGVRGDYGVWGGVHPSLQVRWVIEYREVCRASGNEVGV